MAGVAGLALLGIAAYGLYPKEPSSQVAAIGARSEAARQAQPEITIKEAVLKYEHLKKHRCDIEGGRAGVPNYNPAWRARNRLIW